MKKETGITLNDEPLLFGSGSKYEFGTFRGAFMVELYTCANTNRTECCRFEILHNGEKIDHEIFFDRFEEHLSKVINREVNNLLDETIENGRERLLKAEKKLSTLRENIDSAIEILSSS